MSTPRTPAWEGSLGFCSRLGCPFLKSESHPGLKGKSLPGLARRDHGPVGGQGLNPKLCVQGQKALLLCHHSRRYPTNGPFTESLLTLGLSKLKLSTLQFLKVNLIRAFYKRSRNSATYIGDIQLSFPPLPFETIAKPPRFCCLGEDCATRSICKQLIFQMGDGHHRCRPFQNKH